VWDAVVHGWRTEQNLSRERAQQRAAELTRKDEAAATPPTVPAPRGGSPRADHTAHAGRAGRRETDAGPHHPVPADVRIVDPAIRVEIFADGDGWSGDHDRRARHADGWYGRATRDAGRTSDWYPSGQLRPGE